MNSIKAKGTLRLPIVESSARWVYSTAVPSPLLEDSTQPKARLRGQWMSSDNTTLNSKEYWHFDDIHRNHHLYIATSCNCFFTFLYASDLLFFYKFFGLSCCTMIGNITLQTPETVLSVWTISQRHLIFTSLIILPLYQSDRLIIFPLSSVWYAVWCWYWFPLHTALQWFLKPFPEDYMILLLFLWTSITNLSTTFRLKVAAPTHSPSPGQFFLGYECSTYSCRPCWPNNRYI